MVKTKQIKKTKTLTFPLWLGRNLMVCALFFLLVLYCYKKIPGYTWVHDGLLRGNMQVIKQYGQLSLDQKYEMKLGYTYAYLRYIKQQTPEDAIILMPSDADIYFSKGSRFTGEPNNKLWSSRFLYPRKLVYVDEQASAYMSQITHVAIINGWGYDKLPYKVSEQVANTIFPLNINQ